MDDKDTYAENIGNAVAEYSLETQSEQALRHYEGISRAVMHWSSFIEDAIREYPKLKALEAELTELQAETARLNWLAKWWAYIDWGQTGDGEWFMDSTEEPLPEFSVRGKSFRDVLDAAMRRFRT